jgi:hypothetical protein
MNTPTINRTAALALAAAKRNTETPKDIARSPSWNAPVKQEVSTARTLIEKGVASISNRGALPSVVQSYMDQLHGKTTLQALPMPFNTTGKVSEAIHRVTNLIPSVIAWELNKVADRLTDRMLPASEESLPKGSNSSTNEKKLIQETKSQTMPTMQTVATPRNDLERSDAV